MTLMSGALDKSVFNGISILLKTNEENDKHRYVYSSGNMICSFLTNDNIYKIHLNNGNKVTPYSIAKDEENIFFLTPRNIFIQREMIEDNELLTTNEKIVDPFHYHISNCGEYCFEKLRKYKIHSNFD